MGQHISPDQGSDGATGALPRVAPNLDGKIKEMRVIF